jgi:plastocyanin
MHRLRSSFVLLVLAALSPLACGGGASEGDSGVTTGGQTPTSAQATAPASTPPSDQSSGGGASVSMRNIKYVPANVTVKQGQTIRWTNDDAVAHTVTATSGARFDSGTVEAGGKYQYKPTSTGRISYYCTIHGQQQSGTITVR